MGKFESAIAYLFPTLLIDDQEWRKIWDRNQQDSFLTIARVFFPFVGIAYILHYFFFDKPMGLEPLSQWLAFRVSIAVGCLACLGFYFSPWARTRYFKLPALLMCSTLCITQALVAVWYGLEAWVFCFIFVLASVLMLRTTVVLSLAFAIVIIAIQTPILLAADVAVSNIVSGTFATIAIIPAIRSSYITEVRHFLLNQRHTEAQEKINELSSEFSNRLRSFIPRVIATRLENLIQDRQMTVLEASIEALKARRKNVACLFSDIRGFTQNSKQLEQFVGDSVIPEVKQCSDAVEAYSGIPRKIGDLIFAYFDDDSVSSNLVRAILCGMEISRANEAMNATGTQMNIHRYILISTGEAIVGNFGGLDSSVEITALGSPVNFLSRIDDLTKEPKIVELISPGDLLLCEASVELLRQLGSPVSVHEIDIHGLGLEVRDFPETSRIFSMKATDSHFDELLNLYENKYNIDESERGPIPTAA